MCKFCEPTTPFSTDPDFYPELGDKEPASTTNACYPIVDSRSNDSDVLKIEDRCSESVLEHDPGKAMKTLLEKIPTLNAGQTLRLYQVDGSGFVRPEYTIVRE